MHPNPPNPLLTELVAGESLIWQGKPEKWPFITMGPLHMILFVPFSLGWGAFFIYLETLAIRTGSAAGAAFGAPFLLVGLYLIGGRFWLGVRCWKNTYYAVTSKRILIRLGSVSPKVMSLGFPEISSATLQIKHRKLGHLNFNSGHRYVFDSIFIWQPGPSCSAASGLIVKVLSFRYIREPEKVLEIIESFLTRK